MKKKQIDQLIESLKKRAQNTKRMCCFPNCNEAAINSHLLQRNGILRDLSENTSALYELKHNPFKYGIFYFKLEGIGNTFTFPGFCNKHDTELFKPIEDNNINYYDYKTQLLFAYRAVMNEKRKKEIIVDFYNKLLGSNILRSELDKSYFDKIEISKQEELQGIQDETYYENLLLTDILQNNQIQNFKFVTYDLPLVDVCSSGIFTYETTIEINELYSQNRYEEPLTAIYFNLLPIKGKSIVIIGCANEHVDKCWNYIDSFIHVTPYISLKKISDLLLSRLENWLCSPSFFKNNISDREKEIIAITQYSVSNPNEREELNFNLFDRLDLNK